MHEINFVRTFCRGLYDVQSCFANNIPDCAPVWRESYNKEANKVTEIFQQLCRGIFSGNPAVFDYFNTAYFKF